MSTAPLELHATSEIGRLRHVMVHTPGAEVDTMTPALMERMLFDDIIYGDAARTEHRRFRAVMEAFGVTTWDSRVLLLEAMRASPEGMANLVDEVADREGLGPALHRHLLSLAAPELAAALIEGVRTPADKAQSDYLFDLSPIPNLVMARDPQVVLGNGVVISAMNRQSRDREALLTRFSFRHHPRLAHAPIHADFVRGHPRTVSSMGGNPTLEGGDVLLLKEGILVIGISQRTMERAADQLCDQLRALDLFHHALLVRMPSQRGQMHLDTIFTRLSPDEFLVYPPMILPDSSETLTVVSVELGEQRRDWGRRRPSLVHALAELGVEFDPVCCGGPGDYVRQTREQWTDGANSLALAPGWWCSTSATPAPPRSWPSAATT